MKKLQDYNLSNTLGGMSCAELYSQLAWMIGQGGSLRTQAQLTLILMAGGYQMCTY